MVGRKILQFAEESKRKVSFSSIYFLILLKTWAYPVEKFCEGEKSAIGQGRGTVSHA